jgi:uncharacterized damage-inducible protein DinB
MITMGYVRSMAAYNGWQNQNLYSAADGLSDAARKAPRRAFFGSIHGTLNHLLWADQLWMRRLPAWCGPRRWPSRNRPRSTRPRCLLVRGQPQLVLERGEA